MAYGAILGDIIGSPYEYDWGNKTKDFPLFNNESSFTDDSVMTIAVAEALLSEAPDAGENEICAAVIKSMRKWGTRYPYAGYGSGFCEWLRSKDPKPYGSFGNGAAMRISAAGWLYDTLERTLEVAEWATKVTHNHPYGIEAARAIAGAIFLARNKATKKEIRAFIEEQTEYDLSKTCDEIRPGYVHTTAAKGSVPQAITAFLESESYEDAVRTAVSLGGDTDTTAAIAGSIAEAYFGMPVYLKEEVRVRIPEDMRGVLYEFDGVLNRNKELNHEV